ncbi:MAG: 3-hydroxyacyl-[acyl-carrier-protein] dehydratase FabZ [Alphaproteobacteria bacterium CG_4_10_14_0_8_um_filter_37_21]|nr:MAG: 3-hydroxyacyl-[acyl-carrier-protein] dehydratase FabZ [Alphaproteobacteria bacterium CG_4_10_14_0_8_um_filter_37_21]
MTDKTNALDIILDINAIKKLLPHRYPFLLVDKVKNIVPFESATGIKMVTANEWYFEGHFPNHPIMPGVLIIEAMAQTAGVLILHSQQLEKENQVDQQSMVYFMSMEKVKFRKPIVPGDALEIEIKKERVRGNVWRFVGKAFVDGALTNEATFTAMVAH